MKTNFFNRHSIFFTINISFIISFIIVILSFSGLYQISLKRQEHFINKSAIDISKMILREQKNKPLPLSNEFKQYLSQLDYHLVEDQNLHDNFFQQPNIHLVKQFKLKRSILHIYYLDDKRYLVILNKHNKLILQDCNDFESHTLWLFLIFVSILAILGFLYRLIVKKLHPLQQLQQNIQKLSNEEFDINCSSTKKDEISLLSNEFHKTVLTLKKIQESRNIFIRNIMHELKTPITKGKFLSELEHTPKNNEKLKDVFFRLEALIQEFASIEELISTKKVLTKKEYFLEDIIDESLDLLMIDEELVIKQYDETLKLTIDFKLFTIAIKNLLDNGLKYSSNNQVIIENKNNQIIFINKGEALQYSLKQYFEPFFKGKNSKSNESFGLGLYIIHHILRAHNLTLEYEHKDGANYFMIS